MLQWSRDDDVAESHNFNSCSPSEHRLQWSRDDDVAESGYAEGQKWRVYLLQWSRDDDVAERRGLPEVHQAISRRFNGAATMMSRKVA